MVRTAAEERRRAQRRSSGHESWSPVDRRRDPVHLDTQLERVSAPRREAVPFVPPPRREELLVCTRCQLTMSPGRSRMVRDMIRRGELRADRPLLCANCLAAVRGL